MKQTFLLLFYAILAFIMPAKAQYINTSLAVGTPGGSLTVSPLGGASYNIPLEVPSGRNGIQPQLAITYNSQTGNGLAGWGCSLTGISAITRGVRDVYHDSVGNGITYTSDDAFYLDGQRLIRQDGAADSVVFCPENDPYTRVVMHDANSLTDSWFSVTTPDGLKLSYGLPGCRLLNLVACITKVHAWYISRCETTANCLLDYMEYSYSRNSYFMYPDSIRYGRFVNGRFVNKVVFTYENRFDEQKFALVGNAGIMKKRLKAISSSTFDGSQWNTYRTYTLNYNSGQADASTTGYSRLTSVSVSNGDGDSMNPIALQWSCLPAFSTQSEQHSLQLAQSSNQFTFSDFSLMSADMDGDGVTDIIQHALVEEAVNGHREPRNFYYVHYVGKNSNGTLYSSAPIMCKFPPDIQASGMWTFQKNSPLLGDLDGDGRADLLLPYLYSSSGGATAEIHYLLGKDVSYNYYGTNCLFYLLRHSSETPLYAMADFNLDGCSDVAVLEKAGSINLYDFHLFGGNHDFPGTNVEEYHTSLYLHYPPKKLFSSDYNGDGLPDLMIVTEFSYEIFWNNGNGLTTNTFRSNKNHFGTILIDYPIVREGDFNGDGIADFLTNAADSGQWYFLLGSGDGGFTKTLACTLDVYEQSGTSKDDDSFTCLVYDMDGDGKSDVFISKAMFSGSSFNKTKSYWMVSNGTTLTQLSSSTSNKEENAMPRYYTAGDFGGSGLGGLMHYGYNCYNATNANVESTLHVFRNSNWQAGTGKVCSVTNGLGLSAQITYKSLTDVSVYTKSSYSDDTPPLLTITPPLSVVSQVITGNGAADPMTNVYTYKDLKYHNQGRGLLGFNTSTVYNVNTNTTTRTTVTRSPVTLLPQQVEKVQITGNLSAITTNTYLSHYHNNTKALYSTLLETAATDMDGNNTTTTYANDSTRNNVPLSVSVQGFDGATVTTSYGDYVLRRNRYLPQTVTEQKRHPDHSSYFTDVTTYEYDTKGRKTKEVAHAGTSKALTTAFTYGYFDNPTAETTTATDIDSVVKLYDYDPTYRFVTKATERGYIVNEYTYDIWGNVLTNTDKTRTSSPMVTAYSYDGWGRLTHTDYPTGQTTIRTMEWGSSPSMRYKVYEKTSGQPWTRTWYDNAGHEVRRESVGPKGLALQQDFSYNAAGLLSQKVDHRGSVTVTETMTYDTRGRMLTDIDDLGRNLSYTYGTNSVTTSDHGRSYTKIYDSWGNVKRSSDPVTYVTYMYHSCGKPKSATSAGATVTMGYDVAGNQTSLTDPDAGTMTYTYDALGRVKTQTDGNGIQTTNTYNSLGQLAQSLIGTVATTYTYGATATDKGLLTSMSRNGFTETFQYDACGRVTQDTRDFGTPGTRTISYAYNSSGLVASRNFPGQLQISYEYDGNGFLELMRSGGNVLYEVQSYETPNQYHFYSEAELGGSMPRMREYDRAGRMTYSATAGCSDYIAPQLYTYDDATGNMTSRSFDGTTFENFTYDALDRLTRSEIDDSTMTFLVYDTNGNIDVKFGTGHRIGSYYYNSSRPHAVTDIENPLGPVDVPSWTVNVTYNELGKAASVYDTSQYPSTITYQYGPDHQRWRSSTHLFFGDYEERYVSSNMHRSYVYLDGGVLAVANNGGTYTFYYIHTDHQGSVLAVTDAGGNHVFKATYDPWGRQTVETNTIAFYRGYTGHEMLKQGSLINMNGRIYDPAIGLFLSPDNYVQQPWNSQNFNRYSYCLNNPLKYTDPSGELFGVDDLLAAVIIGAAIGGAFNLGVKAYNGQINSWGDGFAAFGIGAAAGALGAVTGGGAAAAMESTTVGACIISGMVSAAYSVPVQSMGNSMYFGDPMISGNDYALSVVGSGLASGAIAFAGNAINGRNLWTGEMKPYSESQSMKGMADKRSDIFFDSSVPENHQIDMTPSYNQNPKPNEWPNPSAVPGTGSRDLILSGVEIDRWSPSREGVLRGTYFSTPEVDIRYRAIPYNPDRSYHAIFKVLSPLSVNGSLSSPSFIWNSPGMGYQFQFVGNKSAQQMIDAGYIKLISIRIGK